MTCIIHARLASACSIRENVKEFYIYFFFSTMEMDRWPSGFFFSFFFYRPSVNTFPPKWTDPISITIGGGISACITSRDTSFVVCCNLLCGRRMQVLRRWMESELLEKEEENRQRYNRLLLHTRKEPTTPGGAGGQERDNRPRPWLHLGRWLGLFLFFSFFC